MQPTCGLLAVGSVDLSFDPSCPRRRITRSWSLAPGTEPARPGMHPPLATAGTGPLRGILPSDAGHLGRVLSTLPSPCLVPLPLGSMAS